MHFSLLARNTLDLRSRIRSAPLVTLLHSLAKVRSSHWSVACLRNPQQQRLHSTLPSAMEPGVIAVIGTTGVGKSNLSIQLAKELDGEVINADALQVYKGLDIITNKMPMDEREGITHHVMDFLPLDQEYSVIDFKADALALIKQIHDRKRMPVVVGGTHYYIQSLLWRDTLLDTKKGAGTVSNIQLQDESDANEKFLKESDTPTLYQKLKEIDPIMAKKWHENDRRKITRSLQVYFETGECQSDLIKKQHASPNNERLRMPSCIFWVYSAPDVLNARLDARVDAMIKGGLFDEIKGMRENVGSNTDYERGIWQAIGYKEFDPYFTAIEEAIKDNQSTDTEELAALKAECTEVMKTRTRQYAKRQVLWIRNKFLPLCREKDVKIFLLDATSLDTWKANVGDVAVKIAKDFFAGNTVPDPEDLNPYAKEMLIAQRDLDAVAALEAWEKKECEICTEMQRVMHDKYGKGSTDPIPPVIIHGPTSWEQHLKSKQHRKLKANMAEMERDGANWWYFKAQEYKKRKREGTLNSDNETAGENEGAGSTKVRKTDNDE
ncbi:MAG: IPP transferase-domain-containing protein [Benniella sp.]|nr:MAG: IPP transferase-domain-containing protein [Benniella sp.]